MEQILRRQVLAATHRVQSKATSELFVFKFVTIVIVINDAPQFIPPAAINFPLFTMYFTFLKKRERKCSKRLKSTSRLVFFRAGTQPWML